MKRSRSSWRRRGRGAQILIVLLFVGSWISSAAHRISTPHRLCEVHGTLEHGFETELAPPSGSAPLAPVVRSEGRAHEECQLGPFTRSEATPLVSPDYAAALALRPAGIATLPRSELPPDSARYRLAPSRSPPA